MGELRSSSFGCDICVIYLLCIEASFGWDLVLMIWLRYEEKARNCWWGRHVRKRTWKMYSPMDDKQLENYGRALLTLTVFVRQKKKGAEGNCFDSVWLPPSRLSSSLLLSSVSCCLSFFFYLTKTVSLESVCLYFSHPLSSIDENIFRVLFPVTDVHWVPSIWLLLNLLLW